MCVRQMRTFANKNQPGKTTTSTTTPTASNVGVHLRRNRHFCKRLLYNINGHYIVYIKCGHSCARTHIFTQMDTC